MAEIVTDEPVKTERRAAKEGLKPAFGAAGYFVHNDRAACDQLQTLFDKHAKGDTSVRGAEYRKRTFEYLTDAMKENIDVEDALNFLKTVTYSDVREHKKDCSGGQVPYVGIASSTSEDGCFEIFSEGIRDVKSHKMVGGAFGGAINIRKEDHLEQQDDFISMMYVLRHLQDEKKPLLPYILFNNAFGSHAQENDVKKETMARELEMRREQFVKKCRQNGFTVEGTDIPYLVMMQHSDEKSVAAKEVRVYLPVVIHDLKTCTFEVLENGQFVPFDQWARNNKDLHEDERVLRQLENLENHKKEAPYYDPLMRLTSMRKGVYCMDSRHQRREGSAIKTLGSITSEEEKKRIASTPTVSQIVVCLHLGCGYLTTAMRIHLLAREMEHRFREGEKTGRLEKDVVRHMREMWKETVEKIFTGQDVHFDCELYLHRLEQAVDRPMLPEQQKMLENLTSTQFSDARNTVKDMYENKLLGWDKTGANYQMNAAQSISRNIKPVDGQGDLTAEYVLAVTIEVAAQETDEWKKALENYDADIRSKRAKAAKKMNVDIRKAGQMPSIKVEIENFATGEVFVVKDNGRGRRQLVDAVDGHVMEEFVYSKWTTEETLF